MTVLHRTALFIDGKQAAPALSIRGRNRFPNRTCATSEVTGRSDTSRRAPGR
jgi:hypothetical protein